MTDERAPERSSSLIGDESRKTSWDMPVPSARAHANARRPNLDGPRDRTVTGTRKTAASAGMSLGVTGMTKVHNFWRERSRMIQIVGFGTVRHVHLWRRPLWPLIT